MKRTNATPTSAQLKKVSLSKHLYEMLVKLEQEALPLDGFTRDLAILKDRGYLDRKRGDHTLMITGRRQSEVTDLLGRGLRTH